MEQTNLYELGHHERWECYLHYCRKVAKDHGRELSFKEEEQILSEYLTNNRQCANEIVACSVCEQEIAEARLAGRDPYEIPDFVRQVAKRTGFRLPRTQLGRRNKGDGN
jgi:hypothetical protein